MSSSARPAFCCTGTVSVATGSAAAVMPPRRAVPAICRCNCCGAPPAADLSAWPNARGAFTMREYAPMPLVSAFTGAAAILLIMSGPRGCAGCGARAAAVAACADT